MDTRLTSGSSLLLIYTFHIFVNYFLIKTCLCYTPQLMNDQDYDYLDGSPEEDDLADTTARWKDEVETSPTPMRHGKRRNCTTDTAIIDALLNGTGYNKFRVPDGVRGVDVAVEFWLQAITAINEITNDFEVSNIYVS
ncbi:hypothetical protein AB6A40_004039 [Gnathostoma spinigerum]|uniref:Uncharacterized protein n=1 Tax=Gnathostoma spinigerum TaxID=75299 RepID=A0ABD6EBB4_9BILA